MIRLDKPNIEVVEEKEDFAKFAISPLEKGYGVTLGNALRRVLLSSIPGAAATAIQIDGVLHEFTAIPGVREDVTEIVLNAKSLVLTSRSAETKILYLGAKGEGPVTAKDIEEDAEVELFNPELHLATLDNEKSEFRMQIYVEQGRDMSRPNRTKKRISPSA